VVIEGERRQVVEREPGDPLGVGRRADLVIAELDQRVVRDRHDPLARIALERAEGVELLEERVGDAGLLAQLAARRLVERLVDVHEAARQGPRVRRRQRALDQEHLEVGGVEAEHDAVDGERRPRVLVAERTAVHGCVAT
jgi:hypothetical protein